MAANQDPERLMAAASLLIAARQAVLATVHEGAPHASLVTPALDEQGVPILLLSALAAHTKHLLANPACALLVTGRASTDNPQTAPRLSLTGTARQTAGETLLARYLTFHPYARQYAGFRDFSFWRITVSTVQYIGGFADAGILDCAALQQEISTRLRYGYG